MKRRVKKMKLQKADKGILNGYKPTKLMGIINEFVKSWMDCAAAVYSDDEYCNPTSCYNALKVSIKRSKMEGTVGVRTINKTVYLYRKECTDE